MYIVFLCKSIKFFRLLCIPVALCRIFFYFCFCLNERCFLLSIVSAASEDSKKPSRKFSVKKTLKLNKLKNKGNSLSFVSSISQMPITYSMCNLAYHGSNSKDIVYFVRRQQEEKSESRWPSIRWSDARMIRVILQDFIFFYCSSVFFLSNMLYSSGNADSVLLYKKFVAFNICNITNFSIPTFSTDSNKTLSSNLLWCLSQYPWV